MLLAIWCLIVSFPYHGIGILAFSTKKPRKKQERVKPIPFIATASVAEHCQALSQYLQKGDRVLELGTQLDASTVAIQKAVGLEGHAVLVDLKRSETNSGRTSQGTRDEELLNDPAATNLDFVELDQFSQWRSVAEDKNINVLVLDVAAMLGNDLELTALFVMMQFVDQRPEEPRLLLIKSKVISSLARRLVHGQRLLDGTFRKSLKSPSRSGKPYIVAAVGVEEYRRTIPHAVKSGDEAVEVGCFMGTTTNLVHEAAQPKGYCIGVDIGPKIIARAQRHFPNVQFAVGDAWKTLDLLRLKRKLGSKSSGAGGLLGGFDVVYADIGGLSGPDGTLEALSLLDALGNALEPRCVVIKSLCVRRLASSLRAYSDLRDKRSSVIRRG